MKLIEQLVEYLRSRGSITPQQVKRLAGKGFIPPLKDEEEAGCSPEWQASEEPSWEDLYAEPARPSRKGRRKVRNPEREPGPEELCVKLAERFPGWEQSLQGLVIVESRLGPCSGWRQAAEGIGKRSQDELAAALAATLRDGPRSAKLLWEALHFEGPRDGLDALAGETGNAYRALLRGGPVAEVSRYLWLLRYEEPADVYRLVRAQKALAQALRAVHRTAPQTVHRGLRSTGRFHLLALLEAAGWVGALTQRLTARAARCYLLPPGAEEWWPAWSVALQIDPTRVAALLQHCKADPFVPVPPHQVPGELWRFTVGEEEWRGRADDEGLLAAIRQVIAAPQDLCGTAVPAGLGHPYPLVRWHALEKTGGHNPAGLVAALDDPEWEIGLRAGQRLLASGDEALLAAVISALPAILAAVGESSEARLQALQLLASLGPRAGAAVGLLASWSSDPSREVRQQLARTLGRLQAAAAGVPALLVLVRDPSWLVSLQALASLGELGAAAAPAVGVLLEILGDADAAKRIHAVRALGAIGTRAEEVIPALTRTLEDCDAGVRGAALACLARFGPSAAPTVAVLVRCLEDPALSVRRAAIEALTGFEMTAAVVAPLVHLLAHDPSSIVRGEASTALVKVSPLALLPHLPELVRVWATPEGSRNATATLLAPFSERAAEAIRESLRHPGLVLEGGELAKTVEKLIRRQAAARIRETAAVVARVLPPLAALALDEPEGAAGRKALELLAAAGPQAALVVAVLAGGLDDADAEVRTDAAAALEHLADCAGGLLPAVLQQVRAGAWPARSAAVNLLEWLAPLAVVEKMPGGVSKRSRACQREVS